MTYGSNPEDFEDYEDVDDDRPLFPTDEEERDFLGMTVEEYYGYDKEVEEDDDFEELGDDDSEVDER
jgi:hypothetical protein